MKFQGELKFPEVDHPGVPVSFLIDGDQAEIVVDGESLGKWSLYDIHARRLVASAFLIDLEGTEVTFVAQDPIDFAYRGVEHMAGSWATINAKRMASRSLAIRKSRRGTTASRLDDLRTAMQANLETISPRRIAGQAILVPEPPAPAESPAVGEQQAEAVVVDWDKRGDSVSIPLVGSDEPEPQVPDVVEATQSLDTESTDSPDSGDAAHPEVLAARTALDEERRRLTEERELLEAERRAAEEREANLLEAYRLEIERLEAERAELRQGEAEIGTVEPEPIEQVEAVAAGVVQEPEPIPEPEGVFASDPEPEPEPDPEKVLEFRLRFSGKQIGRRVLDLNDFGERTDAPAKLSTSLEPDLDSTVTGASKERRGLKGAVKAAFRGGPRDHMHQFIEAPGGIGITRYVCEQCGYVSIGAGD